MLTSYEALRGDIEEINKIDWACAFFDEAHKIKSSVLLGLILIGGR